MISRRSGFGAVTINSTILVLGGFTGSNNSNLCEIYNPRTNSWHALPNLKTERVGLVAAILGVPKWRSNRRSTTPEPEDIT